MSARDYYNRLDRIPEPIREIGQTNPAVSRICTEFAQGSIVTLDEALCQMVVLLARDWTEQQRKMYELVMLNTQPQILSPKP